MGPWDPWTMIFIGPRALEWVPSLMSLLNKNIKIHLQDGGGQEAMSPYWV